MAVMLQGDAGIEVRVGLAAALLHEPQLIVLDEPTSGLDPVQIREFRGLIRELAGAHTILLSTHILSEVEMTCDRVVIIAQGRVRADGTLAELREAASKTRRYVIETTLGSAPQALLALPGVHAVDGGVAHPYGLSSRALRNCSFYESNFILV